jgi:hypothetical protein
MINLSSTSDILQLITDAASDIEVHVSWVDLIGTTVLPDRKNNASITTATTTTILPSPAASTVRNAKLITIHNNHATVSCGVRLIHNDGTTTAELFPSTLSPGSSAIYSDAAGWQRIDSAGVPVVAGPAATAYAEQVIGFQKTITAVDAAGYWYSTSKDGGFPGAWAVGTPGLNGRNTDGTTAADAGCFPVANAGTGTNYLKYFSSFNNATTCYSQIVDVVWVNSGLVVTTTTNQAITTAAFPARDINSSANGAGYRIGILCTAAVGLAAVASNATVAYTNSAGNTGKTATLIAVVGSQAPATPVIGTVIWFNLAAGDVGVKAIEGVTLGTSWVSGSISLFVGRIVASVNNVSSIGNAVTYENGAILQDGCCLLQFHQAAGTGTGTVVSEIVVQER